MADFASMGAMGGAMAANEEAVRQQELAVKSGELGFQLQDLDVRRQKAQQDLLEKETARSGESFKFLLEQIGGTAKENGQAIPRDSPIFDGLTKQAKIFSQALKLGGGDGDLPFKILDSFTAMVSDPKLMSKQMTLSPGQKNFVPQVGPDGSIKMVENAGVPSNPQVVAPGAGLFGPTGNKIAEQPANPNANQPRYTSPTPVFDQAGKQVAYATMNDRTGQREFHDFQTGEVVPGKPDWTTNTLSSQQFERWNGMQMKTNVDKLIADRQSIDVFHDILKNAQDADTGLKLFATQATAGLKALFGHDLTDKEVADKSLNGELQQAFGKLRIPLLGGGYLTEFDAQRLIAAMGGNADAFRSPQVMARLMKPMVGRMIDAYEIDRNMVNTQIERAGNIGIKPFDPVDPAIRQTFEAKMKGGAAKPARSAAPTQADLEFTAKTHDISIDAVKQRLGIR